MAGGAGGDVVNISSPITLTITAPAGVDAREVAQLVRQKAEKGRRRQAGAYRRGLYDRGRRRIDYPRRHQGVDARDRELPGLWGAEHPGVQTASFLETLRLRFPAT